MSQEFCPSSFPTILELYSSDSKMTINVDNITEDDMQFLQAFPTHSQLTPSVKWEDLFKSPSYSIKPFKVIISFSAQCALLIDQINLIYFPTPPLLLKILQIEYLSEDHKFRPTYIISKNKQDPIKNSSTETKISCVNISCAYKISFIAYSAFSLPNKITSEDTETNPRNEFANLDNEVAQISEQAYADQSSLAQDPFIYSSKNQKEKEENLPKFSIRDSELLSTRIRGNQDNSIKKYEIQLEDFKATLNKIILNGLVLNQVPSSSYKEKYLAFSQEIDYLLGLSLISGKRNVQACELLRKIENYYIQKIEKIESNTNQNIQGSQNNFVIHSPQRHYSSESAKLISKAAKIELIIADCLNPFLQISEKLSSYRRVTEISVGSLSISGGINASQFFLADDTFTTFMKLHPHLIKFILSVSGDNDESLKMASIRSMDYVLENMGCSIGNYIVLILKYIIAYYPKSSAQYILNPENPYMTSTFNNNSIITDMITPKQDKQKEILRAMNSNENCVKTCESNYLKMSNLYNHLLETFLSVLSSVSGQVLHKIFNEIIQNFLFSNDIPKELKSYLSKICDKIITICQGDIILSSSFLGLIFHGLIIGVSDPNYSEIVSIWSILKSKIFSCYSHKGHKKLVEWIMMQISTIQDIKNLNESDLQKLKYLIEIIKCVTNCDKIEDNSSLIIKGPQEVGIEYYNLLHPLLFIIDQFSQKENHYDLFKDSWKAASCIFRTYNKYSELNTNKFLTPYFIKMNDYLIKNAPTVGMLKFIHLVIDDFSFDSESSKQILIQLLERIIQYIPGFINEEIFNALDKLIAICKSFLTQDLISKLIDNLISKYTIRTKREKQSKELLISILLGNGNEVTMEANKFYIDTCIFKCIIGNQNDLSPKEKIDMLDQSLKKEKNVTIEKTTKNEYIFCKINFLIEILKAMNEKHTKLMSLFLLNKDVSSSLVSLLRNGQSTIRLKVFEVLEVIHSFFQNFVISKLKPEEKNNISNDQLGFAKLIISVSIPSLENANDPYLQFNALINLESMFQHILPTLPITEDNNIAYEKSPNKISKNPSNDFESADLFNNTTEYKVNDLNYLNSRMYVVLKIWGSLQNSINSSWSNIRSICYGLICTMIKINVINYRHSYKIKLKQNIVSLLTILLESKESESKAGGLNILGSFCGLSEDFTKNNTKLSNCLNLFRRNSHFVNIAIWKQVFELQDDWDSTIREASIVLTQLCAPKESVKLFHKLKMENMNIIINNISQKITSINSSKPLKEGMVADIFEDQNNLGLMMNEDEKVDSNQMTIYNQIAVSCSSSGSFLSESEETYDEGIYFYMDKYNDTQLIEIVSIFRNDFKPPKNLWIEHTNPELIEANEKPGLGDEFKSLDQISQEFFEGQTQNRMLDIVEDKLINQEGKKPEIKKLKTTNRVKIEELPQIPLRKPKKKDPIDAESYKFLNNEEDMENDELGIIDIDDDIFFNNIEDPNIPVIKNSFKKSQKRKENFILEEKNHKYDFLDAPSTKKDQTKKVEKEEKKEEKIIKEQDKEINEKPIPEINSALPLPESKFDKVKENTQKKAQELPTENTIVEKKEVVKIEKKELDISKKQVDIMTKPLKDNFVGKSNLIYPSSKEAESISCKKEIKENTSKDIVDEKDIKIYVSIPEEKKSDDPHKLTKTEEKEEDKQNSDTNDPQKQKTFAGLNNYIFTKQEKEISKKNPESRYTNKKLNKSFGNSGIPKQIKKNSLASSRDEVINSNKQLEIEIDENSQKKSHREEESKFKRTSLPDIIPAYDTTPHSNIQKLMSQTNPSPTITEIIKALRKDNANILSETTALKKGQKSERYQTHSTSRVNPQAKMNAAIKKKVLAQSKKLVKHTKNVNKDKEESKVKNVPQIKNYCIEEIATYKKEAISIGEITHKVEKEKEIAKDFKDRYKTPLRDNLGSFDDPKDINKSY